MWEEFVHTLASHKLRLDHINNWGNWGAFCAHGCMMCQEKRQEKKVVYMCTVGIMPLYIIASPSVQTPAVLTVAAMISCHTDAQQESFKLISSRRTCLLQCFNEYSSSCFSLHHLSGMQRETELELSKEQPSTVLSIPWCLYLCRRSLWWIFSALIHKALPTKIP